MAIYNTYIPITIVIIIIFIYYITVTWVILSAYIFMSWSNPVYVYLICNISFLS